MKAAASPTPVEKPAAKPAPTPKLASTPKLAPKPAPKKKDIELKDFSPPENDSSNSEEKDATLENRPIWIKNARKELQSSIVIIQSEHFNKYCTIKKPTKIDDIKTEFFAFAAMQPGLKDMDQTQLAEQGYSCKQNADGSLTLNFPNQQEANKFLAHFMEKGMIKELSATPIEHLVAKSEAAAAPIHDNSPSMGMRR